MMEVGPVRADDEIHETVLAELLDGAADAVWLRFAPPMKSLFGDLQSLESFLRGLRADFGEPHEVVETWSFSLGESWVSERRITSGKLDTPGFVSIVSRKGTDTITGLLVNQEPRLPPSPHADSPSRTDLRLPVTGSWFVLWGGDNPSRNRHAATPCERFAVDLVAVGETGTHRFPADANEAFHCFGRPVLAPADGRVVSVLDGIEDNAPGVLNRAVPPGNHVILQHAVGEFSVLAHLRRGSVSVRAGDQVSRGRELGRCGNSGVSTEPHLHFAVQDQPRYGEGHGIPFLVTCCPKGEAPPRLTPLLRGEVVTACDERRSSADE